MNEEDIRLIVRDEIRKSKAASWGETIFSIVMFLLVFIVVVQPIFTKVIFPYWAEALNWSWLQQLGP